MRSRQVVSVFMLVLGTALLVAAFAVGGATSATKRAGSAEALKGATLRLVMNKQTNVAQIVEYNLKAAGFKTQDQPTSATTYFNVIGMKSTTYNIGTGGWCADYLDPFDCINILLDGRSIQAANNVNLSYFNNPTVNQELDAAASLSGADRAAAYAKLDQQITNNYAPWVPFYVSAKPVLRVVACEELDLQLVPRRAVRQRTGGGLSQ